MNHTERSEVPPIVNDVLRSLGQPLDNETRVFMESRLCFNFSQVRLHMDSKAAESTKDINAKAFTIGNDIVFGLGQYDPETYAGKKLMIHELTHVVQQ